VHPDHGMSGSLGDAQLAAALNAEEADECEFWLELTLESQISQSERIRRLLKESGELTAIFTASRDTAKRNLKRTERQ